MQSLTSVERLVIESISQGPKPLKALMQDTRLELRFLANILHALTLRSFIVLTTDGYALNKHLPPEELAQINDEKSRQSEALELLESLCSSKDKKLGLRKAWVSDKDRNVLNALLKNLEDFMQTLPAAPKNAPLHEYTLVVWGADQYGSTVQRLIGGIA